MRAFARGEPFTGVSAEGYDVPVFSEAFLYDCMFKGDARFILAVADEYATLIDKLGEEKVKELLERG